MTIEICKLCNTECTPWKNIDGHICVSCYTKSCTEEPRFIENIKIEIGQGVIGGAALEWACIIITIDNWNHILRLDDLQSWINTIVESNGNGSKKSYEAKNNFDSFIKSLFKPYLKLPELPK